MSAQEEQPIAEKSTPMPAQHKWIAMIIWFGLLAATLITSLVAVSAVTGGGLLSGLLSGVLQALSRGASLASSATGGSLTIVSIVGAALALVAIGFLLNAWLKFVSMSRELIVSFAWLERDPSDVTLFFDWLNFSGETLQAEGSDTVGEIDLDDADGTLVGDVLRYLAYAWVALLAMSPITSLVGAIFT